jgi:tetratricopeptide (TPR) repeat protein
LRQFYNIELENNILTLNYPYAILDRLLMWLKKPEYFIICEKLFKIIDEYANICNDISFLHFYFIHKMEIYYRNRDVVEGAFDKALEYCYKLIEIADELSKYNSSGNISDNPSHHGYKQLAIILFKQGKYQEMIDICEKAKKQFWKGDWDNRIEKAKKKLENTPC